jgi:hypothetical protein
MAINLDGNGLNTTGLINSATAQASTSGTSIDFTGIPSGVKRITVMYNGVSTNGTAYHRIQLGSGSVQTSGYLSYSNTVANSSTNLILAATAGFDWYGTSASISMLGTAVFTLVSGTTWIANGQVSMLSTAQASLVGSVTLTGAIDRVRITTSNGTDTFDAGSINILYE